MEMVADYTVEVQDNKHAECPNYNTKDTLHSSLTEITDACAARSEKQLGQPDEESFPEKPDDCLREQLDIPTDRPIEGHDLNYKQTTEIDNSVVKSEESYKEGQDKCFEGRGMSDCTDRPEECIGKKSEDLHEDRKTETAEKEEIRFIDKSVKDMTGLNVAGSGNSNRELSEVLGLLQHIKTERDDPGIDEAMDSYSGNDGAMNTFFSQNPSDKVSTEEDLSAVQNLTDTCTQIEILTEKERSIMPYEEFESMNGETIERDIVTVVLPTENRDLNTKMQNGNMMGTSLPQPSTAVDNTNPNCLESCTNEFNSDTDKRGCLHSGHAAVQTGDASDGKNAERLSNVDTLSTNHCLTDPHGHNVEESCTMDSHGSSVCCSLVVGKDVYSRIQELLVQGQFSTDDLMKYFFTLHEWYMISSSSASLSGMSESTYCSTAVPSYEKMLSRTSQHQVSEQNPNQGDEEIEERKQQDDANSMVPPTSSLFKNSTECEKMSEKMNQPIKRGFHQRHHGLPYRDDSGLYKCNICRLRTRSSTAILKHLKLHDSEINKCRICGKICGSEFRKHVHCGFHHTNFMKQRCNYRRLKPLQKCEVCGETVWNRKQHSKLCKGYVYVNRKTKEIFKCLKCGMYFCTLTAVQQHIMYRHISKWCHSCPCGFKSHVLSPYLAHKRKCRYSYSNMFRVNIPKGSSHLMKETEADDLHSAMPSEQGTKLENFYATGLHVLADVSEHRLSDVRDNLLRGNALRENVIDLSVQHDVSVDTDSTSHPCTQITSNLPSYQSSFLQQPLALPVPNAHQDLVQRDCNYGHQSAPSQCSNLSLQEVSETRPASQEFQREAPSVTSAMDLTNTDSQTRRLSLENSDYHKKERIRRNSGQGLERAISALRCKALSEMNRRKTADDICIYKDEPDVCNMRQKERNSLDSNIYNSTQSNSSSTAHNPNSYESPFGTAVIDLSKVNVSSLSQLSNEKATASSVDKARGMPVEVPPLHGHHGSENNQGTMVKRIDPSTDDSTVQESHGFDDMIDLSSIRVLTDKSHCPGCAVELNSAPDLLQHIRTSCKLYYQVLLSQGKAKIACRICNIDFYYHKQALIHHIRSVHGIVLFGNVPSRKALICNVCSQTFMNEAYLREHINGKHFGARYSCTCGKTFKWRSSFSGHKRKCNGVITSTVNNRGRGKPLSIPRKRFEVACSDKLYTMTWKRLHSGDTKIKAEQNITGGPKGVNSVPGIETLLANVRKERKSEKMTHSVLSAPSTDVALQPTIAQHNQSIQNKRTGSNSQRDPSSLRISPKVKSFMEPIVQKATNDNMSRSTENMRQANFDISMSASERGVEKRSVFAERQMGGSYPTREVNRNNDNVSASNSAQIYIKQEQGQGVTLIPRASEVKKEQIENMDVAKSTLNTERQGQDKHAMQSAYPVGVMIPNANPYMLYPNMFNLYPSNFQQDQLHGSKPAAQKTQDSSDAKGNDFSNITQANLFGNPMLSVNSLVPFFANALNSIQKSIIPTASNAPNSHDKSGRAERTRTASSSSAVTTSSASISKTPQAGQNFICNSCKKRFSSRKELENHPCKTYCDICKINFKCKASAREHMLGKHGEENRYTCPCGLRFKWRSSLGCHQRNCPKAPPKKPKNLL